MTRHPRAAPADDEDAAGARAVFDRRQRWLLLLGFALLLVLRLPHAWIEGRFQDEVATVFLAYAWHRPWLDALLRPFGGYWNLAANASTLLVVALVKGGVMPLERTPYLTMAMALAVQMLPAVLILTGRGRWLAARAAVIAALLLLALAPSTEEVFYNVLHIQFHLALCAALILALEPPRQRIAHLCYGALLFLGPLCGPGAIMILPLFALRALIDRDRARLGQTAALAAGAAVQLLLFYGANPMRGHLLDPGTIAAVMFVRLIALPAFGFDIAEAIGVLIDRSLVAGHIGPRLIATFAALFATMSFGTLLIVAARRRDAALWLLLAALTVAVASFGYGMVVHRAEELFQVGAGERYNFLPLVLLGLTLVALARRPAFGGRPACVALCLLTLFTGAIHYPKPLRQLRDGPSWPAEVAAWRRDHRHPLAVWPRPWTADLSDGPHVCAPPGPDLARSADPRYCESGWIAGFYRPPLKL